MAGDLKAQLLEAIRQLPQPNDKGQTIDYRCWFDAKYLVCSPAPNGEIILSIMMEPGATLTFLLGTQQAQVLLVGLRGILGDPDLWPPEGYKPS